MTSENEPSPAYRRVRALLRTLTREELGELRLYGVRAELQRRDRAIAEAGVPPDVEEEGTKRVRRA